MTIPAQPGSGEVWPGGPDCVSRGTSARRRWIGPTDARDRGPEARHSVRLPRIKRYAEGDAAAVAETPSRRCRCREPIHRSVSRTTRFTASTPRGARGSPSSGARQARCGMRGKSGCVALRPEPEVNREGEGTQYETLAPLPKVIIYLRKTGRQPTMAADRPVTEWRAYFLARFFGFFGAWCGSGGERSIARSKSSVRRSARSRGKNSGDGDVGDGSLRFMCSYSWMNELSFWQSLQRKTASFVPNLPKVGFGRLPMRFKFGLPQ